MLSEGVVDEVDVAEDSGGANKDPSESVISAVRF